MNVVDVASAIRPADPPGGVPERTALLDFFDNGAVPLHLVGPDGTILHANKAELELLGYPPEDYIGHSIVDFHADRPVIENILQRLSRGETLRQLPVRLLARGGDIKHVELTSSAHFEDGRFVNTRCFSVDVTKLVQAREALDRKELEMRQVLDALPAAIYTTDRHGVITYYNRFAAELAGREPVIGKDEWCVTYRLYTVDGTPLPHSECPMAVALRENRPVRGVEAMAERPDGTMFPFLPFPTPLRDAAGNLVGAVNMLVDVSERKTAEANQKLLLRELNHRVKNNMQMLIGLLTTASREAGEAAAGAVLNDAAQRLGSVAAAQQLLYLDGQARSFSARRFLEAICANLASVFSDGIAIAVESDECELPNDVAMPLALIANELMTNAAKYGVDPVTGGRIAVELRRRGEGFCLAVSDGGPGFDPTAAADRRASGLGLVRGLARQLGGTLSIESGHAGTRCTVEFPVNGY